MTTYLNTFHAMNDEILAEQQTTLLKPDTADLRRALVLAMWVVENIDDDTFQAPCGETIVAELKQIVADALTGARAPNMEV